MTDKRKLDEDTISNIILCEPITKKGVESLSRLGLSTNEIAPDYFYDKLRVESKYDEHRSFIEARSQEPGLYYQYTIDYEQFKSLQNRLKEFDSRFYSDLPYSFPLLMLGVAGNGKSIEVNRYIREAQAWESDSGCGKSYFDLEEAVTKITYGLEYSCVESTPLWLFCIKLLDGIMQYIRSCHLICPEILENFNDIVVSRNLATEERRNLFQLIGFYRSNNIDSETDIFRSLTENLSSCEPRKNIEYLFETLMWLMYCSVPNKKQYIVIDNIEQYIKLNSGNIQILDSDISAIYDSITPNF